MSCLITPMEAEENGCRLSPSAYVSEEYDLEIGVTDLDLEVLMCENSKLQAELEEIQDECNILVKWLLKNNVKKEKIAID
mgnify:CR=1 FL=1